MRPLSRFLATTWVTVAIPGAWAAPMTYEIDPTHTFVILTRGNYGFSNPIVVAVVDAGRLTFDDRDPSKSSVQVTVPISRIETFVPELNLEFQSPMFFDAQRFPTATYKSTAVRPLGAGRYQITGNLTVHGITKPVVLTASLNKKGENPRTNSQAIGFDAVGTLRRSDFGMDFNVPDVSDEISMKITVQADAVRTHG
jgi:polyisoprenoid-binding protein YceI